MKTVFQQILTLTERDLQVELRSKESLFSTLLFVLLTFFIFNFSFVVDPSVLESFSSGLIWVIISFSGIFALTHLVQRDQEDRAIEGLVMTGMSSTTLFFGKFMTVLIFMTCIELIVTPLFMIFFNFQIGDWLLLYSSVLALGTIGYAAIGTLFATMLSHARLKNLLFPIIFFPIVIPILILSVKATTSVFRGVFPSEIKLLFGMDLIFVTASAILFEFVIEDPS